VPDAESPAAQHSEQPGPEEQESVARDGASAPGCRGSLRRADGRRVGWRRKQDAPQRRARSGEGGRPRGFCGAVLCGGIERGTALALAVVASATPLRAQRGDVAERPPAPWGFQDVLDRHRPHHRTLLYRSLVVGLYRCSTNYSSPPASLCLPTLHAGCSPSPWPPSAQSSPGYRSVLSAAQRRQNTFHRPTTVSARLSVPRQRHAA
jgi:hypothetical protein